MKDNIKKLITANKYDLAEMLCKGQDVSLAKCLQETNNLKAYIKHKLQGKDKEYCVKFAVFCAELVLPVWVEKYPNDDRPAKAVKAAKVWIRNPTEQNAAAADTAADAADDAAYAADAAAAHAAYADANAATYAAAAYAAAAYAAAADAAAAYAAAYAADAAAYAADAAAAYAATAAAYADNADEGVLDKIVNYLNK